MIKSKYKIMICTVIVVLIVTILFVLFKDKLLKILYPKTYSEIISVYAEEYDVEENLIYAVIKAESNFDDDAVSNKGATGLMQLMNETAEEVAQNESIEFVSNDSLYNPEINIQIGVTYFANLLEIFGNVAIALAAYNAGMGTVQSWIDDGIIKADGSDIENIPYKDTNMYVRKILNDYEIYIKIYR